jgi:hypothetical protein
MGMSTGHSPTLNHDADADTEVIADIMRRAEAWAAPKLHRRCLDRRSDIHRVSLPTTLDARGALSGTDQLSRAAARRSSVPLIV